MKALLTASLALSLAAVVLPQDRSAQAAPPAAPVSAKPAPPGPADWRTPDPDTLVLIETNRGRIILELVPEAAPQFVARFQTLARQHFYDGQTFFRVIDDFMDQTGDPQNNGTGGSSLPDVPAEFVFRRGPETPFAMAMDHTVDEVGFVRSLPITSQSMMLAPMTKDGRVNAWGLFCSGVAGAARSENPDSANSQFFLMRDRRASLDKHYATFGRVLVGADVVGMIKSGEPVAPPQDRMDRLRLFSDLPDSQRPKLRTIDPAGPWFQAELARVRADRGADFSACDVNLPTEVN